MNKINVMTVSAVATSATVVQLWNVYWLSSTLAAFKTSTNAPGPLFSFRY